MHAYYPGGRPVNYGVQAYLNRDTTAAFFDRFGPGLIDPDLSNYLDLLLSTKNIDFNTGLPVDVSYGPVDLLGIPIALLRYLDKAAEYQYVFLCAKFSPSMDSGPEVSYKIKKDQQRRSKNYIS